MISKEATARIKINRLLEESGWRFFPEGSKTANISLEPGIKIREHDLDIFGQDFEKAHNGYIDFLLLDEKGYPLIILEAKSEDRNPLIGKEQARTYARTMNCRFILLSNGNLHYFWDLERGNPYLVTRFPTPQSAIYYHRIEPDSARLVETKVEDDFIALTQKPNYKLEAGWQIAAERPVYLKTSKLRFLRPYQLEAIHALQRDVKEGKDRFLFEMATGTGKTLTAAAVIKLFLKSNNASRVLFLVDRLELEDQANRNFVAYLSNDFTTVIYKETRDEWRRAQIVVTTVQSLLFDNKYQRLFSPTDFDLVISDEAHRSIGGNARAVFEYFVGYKLGLTATPRDYLKRTKRTNPKANDPREAERRLLLDTYRTFGCESSQPTFRYSLLDGVKDGYLINPTVVDARTEITTELLSEQGYLVSFTDEDGEDKEESYKQREFEKKFFSDSTNQLFCKTFLEHALHDPVSGEFGKAIVFAVSQNHATKITQILNAMADRMYPGKYHSDFAVQVTSQIANAQQFTINFSDKNNNLLGSGNFIPTYKTSTVRVCVTVGMMTTGYDCTDILNIGLFRPIFSPTDFIQIKGRGTRKHNFLDQLFDPALAEAVCNPEKQSFKLFDFFATCEYFEEKFNYDEVLKLPVHKVKKSAIPPGEKPPELVGLYSHEGEDIIASIEEHRIGFDGMKIDRMFFERFEDVVKANDFIAATVAAGHWDRVIDYVNHEVFNKPEEYYSLDKLRKAAAVDRKLTLREILEKVFGLIPGFKSKDELLEEEFAKFVADSRPSDEEVAAIPAIKAYFKAYITSGGVRDIIESRRYTELATNPLFSSQDFKAVPAKYRRLVPEYVKDYVPLNAFVA